MALTEAKLTLSGSLQLWHRGSCTVCSSVSASQNVFVQILQCISTNSKMYLSKFQNVFVQILKCICSNFSSSDGSLQLWQLQCLLICLGLAQFPRHLRTSQTSSTRTSVEDGLQEKKGDRYAIDPWWLSYHQIHIFKEDLLKLSLCCTLIFCQS